jgi:peptidase E
MAVKVRQKFEGVTTPFDGLEWVAFQLTYHAVGSALRFLRRESVEQNLTVAH